MKKEWKQLKSYKYFEDLEIIVYLEYMSNYYLEERKFPTMEEWANLFIKSHNLARAEAEEFLQDIETVQKFFERTYKNAALKLEEVHKYFGSLQEDTMNIIGKSFASILILGLDLVAKELACDEEEAVYSAIYYAITRGADFDAHEAVESIKGFDVLMLKIEELSISDAKKWNLMLLAKNHQKYQVEIRRIIDVVKVEYEKAFVELEDIWCRYLEPVEQILEMGTEEELLERFHMSFEDREGITAYSSLIFYNATGLIELGDKMEEKPMVVGLFYEYASKLAKHAPSQEELMETLKCLGENRKYEIILSLLESPCNGKELAKRLGITPATISHHMGSLVRAGLILLQNINATNTEYRVNRKLLVQHMKSLQEKFEENEFTIS